MSTDPEDGRCLIKSSRVISGAMEMTDLVQGKEAKQKSSGEKEEENKAVSGEEEARPVAQEQGGATTSRFR